MSTNGKTKLTAGLELDEHESMFMKTMIAKLSEKKLLLANLVVQQARVIAEVNVLDKELTDTIRKAAKLRGIDPDNSKKGRWNFDLDSLSFSRVE